MGGLLHLIQRGGDWVLPNVNAHPSTAEVYQLPITVLLYNGPLLGAFKGFMSTLKAPSNGWLNRKLHNLAGWFVSANEVMLSLSRLLAELYSKNCGLNFVKFSQSRTISIWLGAVQIQAFLPPDAMQARPMPSFGVCPSVCMSVTFVDYVKTSNRILSWNFFSPSGSQTILVSFHTKRYGNIPTL